jgi:hypothetical protein
MTNQKIMQLVEKMAIEFNTRPLWKDEVFPHHSYQPLTITNPDGHETQWEAYKIYFLLDMHQIPMIQCRVPLNNLVITQEWVFEKRVEEYLKGRTADYPAIVWKWRNKFYLADGHHRLAANIRLRHKAIKAMVHELPNYLREK